MIVVITGASKGIGKAISEIFAVNNYELILCARNAATLEESADTIRSKNNTTVHTFSADLSKKEEVESFANFVIEKGTPGILVNNAGVFVPGLLMEEDESSLQKMIDTNLYSAYRLSRKLIPLMIKKGSGHIFNICSVASLKEYDNGGSYSISKYALHGFNTNLRHELKATGIKVTGVFPGAVMTDSWGDFDNSSKRIMEASDVAQMIYAAATLSKQAVVEDIVLRPQLGDL